jgi:electron transport complex protein RnfB
VSERVTDLGTAVDALLPQTQCGKCGYAGCHPYAEAIAEGAADINRCPPGGEDTVQAVAALLGVPAKPLDPACGPATAPAIAVIDEPLCIGCTLCLQACPVDAIVGAAKLMHTVIATECTGCGLCLPPCPTDCITLLPAHPPADASARRAAADRARRRFRARNARRSASHDGAAAPPEDAGRRRADTIARALERARRRLAGAGVTGRR